MERKRKYSSDEILRWVEFLAKDAKQSPAALAGMRTLVDVLRHFEYMTENDISFDHPLGNFRGEQYFPLMGNGGNSRQLH
ncbi:MAG: hypothetical protein H7838_05360 [Magnetococcus sp. DMHC-8]